MTKFKLGIEMTKNKKFKKMGLLIKIRLKKIKKKK
jgi:hypothetical protein